jgi:hypothetical protein
MVNVGLLADIPDAPEEAAEFWALDAASGEGTRLTDITKRTRGSFERLLGGRLGYTLQQRLLRNWMRLTSPENRILLKSVGKKRQPNLLLAMPQPHLISSKTARN